MPTNKFIAEILNAAIVGFEQQKLRIDAQIAELRQMLHGGPTATAAAPEVPKGKRRKMNAAARKRIGDAQRKRWAESTKESTPPSPVAPEAPKPKRRLSAAGKKAIGDATRKRWARVRAEAVRAAKAQQAPAAKKAVKKAPVKASTHPLATGHHPHLWPAIQNRSVFQTGPPRHRRLCLSLLDGGHDTTTPRERQPVSAPQIRRLPQCRPPKDCGLSSPHPTRTHLPGPASDPLRHQAQPGMAVIRLLDPNRSARTGTLRTGRCHCPPPYLPGVSRNCRQNRNPCEIPPRPPGPIQS